MVRKSVRNMLTSIMQEILTSVSLRRGIVFTLSQTLVSWRSTLQFIVAFSTTEAEYMTMIEAI